MSYYRDKLRPLVTGAGAYAALSAEDAADALNNPVDAAPEHRDVAISDVEGYLRARLLIAGLRRWVATAPDGMAKDAASELLDILASPRLTVFLTKEQPGRDNVLGLFALLVQAGAATLTADHLAALAAMTLKPATQVIPREQIGWPNERIWPADVEAARAMGD